jgi:hypothetical protein
MISQKFPLFTDVIVFDKVPAISIISSLIIIKITTSITQVSRKIEKEGRKKIQ